MKLYTYFLEDEYIIGNKILYFSNYKPLHRYKMTNNTSMQCNRAFLNIIIQSIINKRNTRGEEQRFI